MGKIVVAVGSDVALRTVASCSLLDNNKADEVVVESFETLVLLLIVTEDRVMAHSQIVVVNGRLAVPDRTVISVRIEVDRTSCICLDGNVPTKVAS